MGPASAEGCRARPQPVLSPHADPPERPRSGRPAGSSARAGWGRGPALLSKCSPRCQRSRVNGEEGGRMLDRENDCSLHEFYSFLAICHTSERISPSELLISPLGEK